MAWKDFTHTIVNNNTPEAISAVSVRCKTVLLQAGMNNSGPVYIGGPTTLNANSGLAVGVLPIPGLVPGFVPLYSGYGDAMDLQSLYVYGATNDIIQGIYEEF
jgi:hypothetical protein